MLKVGMGGTAKGGRLKGGPGRGVLQAAWLPASISSQSLSSSPSPPPSSSSPSSAAAASGGVPVDRARELWLSILEENGPAEVGELDLGA